MHLQYATTRRRLDSFASAAYKSIVQEKITLVAIVHVLQAQHFSWQQDKDRCCSSTGLKNLQWQKPTWRACTSTTTTVVGPLQQVSHVHDFQTCSTTQTSVVHLTLKSYFLFFFFFNKIAITFHCNVMLSLLSWSNVTFTHFNWKTSTFTLLNL